MRVFVEDDCERILFTSDFGCQGNVVDVLPRLKVTSRVRVRFKRRVRFVALEHDYRRRYWRTEICLGKEPREDLAELLQARAYLAYLFLTGVSNKEEILRAHADPLVLGPNAGLSGYKGQKTEDDCEENS